MTLPNAFPPQDASQVDADLQLVALWHAVRRGLKGLLVVSIAIAGLTYATLSLMAPRYGSESQIEFVARRNNPLPEAGDRPGAGDATARLDAAAINTHARSLTSADLLLNVADTLKLRLKPEFNSALGPVDTWSRLLRLVGIGAPAAGESEQERVLSVVRRQLEVAAIKETRSIAIRFNATDGQLAADFANRLADTYRAGLVSQPVEETTKAVAALQPKVESLRKEVLEAEAAVEHYRNSTDQFRSGPQAAPVSDQRMAGLQDELLKSEALRNETDARWRTARELVQTGSAEVLPDVQKSALIQGLIQQRVRLERQIAEASAALLPGHPRMRQLKADVAGLQRQIATEVQKVVQSIQKDARSAALRVESVQRQIEALKSKVVGQSGNEARLKELESVARSKRTELERLQKQLEDNRTVVNIRQVPIEAQVIARAMPSSTPIFPRKMPSTAIAFAAALILGLAFLVTRALVSPAAAMSAARPTARRAPASSPAPAPIEPAFSNPPHPGRSADAARLATPFAAPGNAEPEIAALASRLAGRTDQAIGVRTLVTADVQGLDPSQQALALTEQLAAHGRSVVLVAWSLAGRQLPVVRTTLRKPGINDLMVGKATFEQVIGRLPGSSVHIIQPGSAAADPAAVLAPDHLNMTLDALDEVYDQVVVMADHTDAKRLFEAIEGRFDAAVVAAVKPIPPPPADDDAGAELLGFEVSGIDVVHVPTEMIAQPKAPKSNSIGRIGAKPKRAAPVSA